MYSLTSGRCGAGGVTSARGAGAITAGCDGCGGVTPADGSDGITAACGVGVGCVRVETPGTRRSARCEWFVSHNIWTNLLKSDTGRFIIASNTILLLS